LSAIGPDALLLTADPLILLHLKRITDFAARHRLTTASLALPMVDDGCLISYGANVGDLTRPSCTWTTSSSRPTSRWTAHQVRVGIFDELVRAAAKDALLICREDRTDEPSWAWC
jgi:hypothetical protein